MMMMIKSRVAAVAVALLVLVWIVAPATSSSDPKCCEDFHEWGDNTGCPAEMKDACNTWCQSTCRGGECKQRGSNWHLCHCYC